MQWLKHPLTHALVALDGLCLKSLHVLEGRVMFVKEMWEKAYIVQSFYLLTALIQPGCPAVVTAAGGVLQTHFLN